MLKRTLFACLIALLVGASYAQDEGFTDEELTNYAKVMAWGELEKGKMKTVYNGWIKNNETLEAKRFVEIKKAKGDEAKLQEIAATEAELVAFGGIQTKYDSMRTSFTDQFKGKIKDDIGAGVYNRLKKALRADEELKGRYEGIYEQQMAALKGDAPDSSDD